MTDRLEDALSAFRSEHDRPRGDAQATRRRLLRSAQQRETRRKLSIAASLVVALLATNSVTWAWSTGRLDRVFGEADVERAPPAAEAPSPASRPAERPRPVAEPVAGLPAPAPAEVPATPLPVIPARPRAVRGEAADRPAAAEAPVEIAPEPDSLSAALEELEPPPRTIDADRAAFAEAHRLHFGGGSPAAALSAWDGYLMRFASGRFVPEARFNRAVILLRLRRDAEAREALRPFAQGAYEGLRTREAQDLLDALDRGTLRRDP
jgi:hypothetical protein